MSYEVTFNGDVALQCKNGTYPECRPHFEKQLQKAVELKHLKEEEAVKRLKDADALWEKCKKDPEVKEKLKEREALKKEHEEAILKAASNRLSELRGTAVVVEVSDAKPKKEEKPSK